jgi:hypothetical protein
MPSGGCTNKAVKAIAGLVCGRSGELPIIVLDSDTAGKNAAKSLTASLYQGMQNHIVSVDNFVGFEGSEIEDFLPNHLFIPYLSKLFSNLEDEFVAKSGEPILPQIENFAKNNAVDLPDGWKVLMAKNVKTQLLKDKSIISDDIVDRWLELFKFFSLTDS